MISKENGVIMEDVHSYHDFGLILTQKNISFPEVQSVYVSVPGRDGPIDLSEALTGSVKFNERTISLQFFSIAPAQKWADQYATLLNKWLGVRTHIIFDDDSNYYWNGRIEKIQQDQDGSHMRYSVEIKADPYKMDLYSSTEDWIWDTFDFDNGVANEGKDISVSGEKVIYLYAGRKRAYPIITASVEMKLIFRQKSYVIPKGTTSMYEIVLDQGDNELLFQGSGTITLEYRGGSL